MFESTECDRCEKCLVGGKWSPVPRFHVPRALKPSQGLYISLQCTSKTFCLE